MSYFQWFSVDLDNCMLPNRKIIYTNQREDNKISANQRLSHNWVKMAVKTLFWLLKWLIILAISAFLIQFWLTNKQYLFSEESVAAIAKKNLGLYRSTLGNWVNVILFCTCAWPHFNWSCQSCADPCQIMCVVDLDFDPELPLLVIHVLNQVM